MNEITERSSVPVSTVFFCFFLANLRVTNERLHCHQIKSKTPRHSHRNKLTVRSTNYYFCFIVTVVFVSGQCVIVD